ncbi:Carbon monoxide dehydrogenase [Cupriavidus sp. H18C1]|uniref:CoxG family protein n=1 Tax=Cupriavidus sp. H18C1 TaxID=3241601 RepID=UPI003BB86C0F
MEMTQTHRLPVPQQVAWEALNDTALLQHCIPGCESIEPDGDNAYLLSMTAAVGPVKAKFKGRMALQDIQAPDSYTIAFDGQGGAAGFGKGTAKVRLDPDGDETVLSYTVQAQVGGKIAQIGSRLVDGAARKMADTFFTRFSEAVSGGQQPADGQAGEGAGGEPLAGESNQATAAGEPADNQAGEQTKRKRSWTAWISKS